jgi:hypothetical protein
LPYLKKQITRSSETLQELHRLGADLYAPDKQDVTSLHVAAMSGNPRIAAWLMLATGPQLVYGSLDDVDRRPHHYAANSAPVTRLLLAYDQSGNVEHEDYFGVLFPEPALCADAQAQEEVYKEDCRRYRAELGLESTMKTNVPWWRGHMLDADKFGNTPIHYAALSGNVDVVCAYLDFPGIDIHASNSDGETALDYAAGHRACETAILEKFPDLVAARHGEWQRPRVEEQAETTACRREAEAFVERLRRSDQCL